MLIVFYDMVVNSAIFTASMSDEKYHRISLNFFSGILVQIIYLFFNLVILFTHKSINKTIVFVLALSLGKTSLKFFVPKFKQKVFALKLSLKKRRGIRFKNLNIIKRKALKRA